MKKKWIYNSLLVVFSLVFVFCIYQIASYYIQLGTTNKVKEGLINEVVTYETTDEPTEEPKEEKGYYHAPIPKSINFDSLKAKNEEVVAWIFNENGIINYPVMHTDNNQYYLSHLIDRRQNVNGSIYIDYRNRGDFTDYNTIFYGHSMKNGTMFASLLRYRNFEYFSQYSNFYLYTPTVNYRVEVISAYETNIDDLIYNTITNEEEYKSLISHVLARSRYNTNSSVTVADTLVTFSTCAYSSDDARFVVVGKLCPMG